MCVVDGGVTKLERCVGDSSENNGIALHALVTQHSRGEVAAVDMQAYKVLDSRRDIPGYTFVPVGQLPVAIVAPPKHPEFTYVADYGSRDVRVLRTQSLVAPLASSAEVQVVSLTTGSDAGALPAAPTHMVLAPDEDALIVTVPDQGRVLWLPIVRCASTSGVESTTCNDYGLIDTANIASIALEGSVDLIAPDRAPATTEPPYQKLCGFEQANPEPAAPVVVSDAMLAPAPRPSGLAVDAFCIGDKPCTRRILVSDDALPLIHAIDIDAIAPGTDGSDALLSPIVVGVATKAVAVTPRVPVAIGSDEETQFVYAIDATDGSVLVTEHDRVINVNGPPSARPDRIDMDDVRGLGSQPAAVQLTVLHPVFNVDAPAGQYVFNATADTGKNTDFYCTDTESHSTELPSRLRGVFLAIATTDGAVRIVDVHDMELLDTQVTDDDGKVTTSSCRPCPNQVRAPVVIRHHERLAYNFLTEEGDDAVPLTLQPQAFAFLVDGLGYNVRADGTNGSPDAPSLACIACEPGRSAVFPSASDESETQVETDADGGVTFGGDLCVGATPALLCAGDDPWNASEELWDMTYAGRIPGTLDGAAVFVAPDNPVNLTGSPEVVANVDFCAAGVLGKDAIAAAFADESCDQSADEPVGDQLVVWGTFLGKPRLEQLLSGDAETKAVMNCPAAAKAIKDDPTLELAFEIRRAYSDRVVIGEQLLTPIEGLSTYQDVRDCFGDAPMTAFVRTRNSFTVLGELTGFANNVKANAAGACVVDPKGDPLRRGRARLGCTFSNHAFTVRPRKPGPDDPVQEPPVDVTLRIKMQSPAAKLICDLASASGYGAASIVPVQITYSDVDRQLYLIDIQDRGLVPISLDPFARGVDPVYDFN